MREINKEEFSFVEIINLSDFYNIELRELFDDSFENIQIPSNPYHGLFHDEIDKVTYNSLVNFGRIIKGYQKMQRIKNNLK